MQQHSVDAGDRQRTDVGQTNGVVITVNVNDAEHVTVNDAENDVEVEKLFRQISGHINLEEGKQNNILMSALSSLLGPKKTEPGSGLGGLRKCSAIANTTLFLVDKNDNYEWRANVSAVDDVFVDPSHPPVKGKIINYSI
jgi:hypothetical protein